MIHDAKRRVADLAPNRYFVAWLLVGTALFVAAVWVVAIGTAAIGVPRPAALAIAMGAAILFDDIVLDPVLEEFLERRREQLDEPEAGSA